MLKILHTADNHLRASQYSRFYRADDFTNSVLQVVDIAIAQKVDAILNSGDLLDTTRPTAATIASLKRINDKLCAAGIPMYVISGNHDLTEPHWVNVVNSRTDNKGLIWADDVRFTIKDVVVHALPYSSRDTLLEQLHAMAPCDIVMWHGSVKEFSGIDLREKAASIKDFQLNKFRLALLGDIHVHKHFILEDGCIVAMPGSTEMCQSSEDPEKYCDMYTFTDSGNITTQAFRLKTREAILSTLEQEDDVEDLLKKLSTANKEDPPMVFVKYNRNLNLVQQRIYNLLDPRVGIVRCTPLPRDKQEVKQKNAQEGGLEPVDFLKDFLGETDGDLFELGSNLLRVDCNASDVLDEFIARELR